MRLISAVTTMLSFYFVQDSFIDAFDKLYHFDGKKRSFATINYTWYRNLSCLFISLAVCLIVTVEIVMGEKPTITILDTFSNGIQLLIHLLALVYFELYVIILINNFKFLKTTAEYFNSNYHKCPKHMIKIISTMYDDLCKGAGAINQAFTFPLFSLVSLNFMEILLGAYALTNVHNRNFRFIYWTTFYSVQLGFMLIPAGSVEGKANEISKYLAEANLEPDEEVLKERNHFLLRTLHQTVDFTACGFFPISTSAIVGVAI
ncbi:hypothetical protein PPYR_04662 [Photinus pyralis]|uniref:Gustatory receptor n=1 Tax=Photinus pyralis TaxID=7054 RepID=A0A5N4AYS5_PHOPY|nr:hypothetical protein PPYR_04662 [Photinus pyralis]